MFTHPVYTCDFRIVLLFKVGWFVLIKAKSTYKTQNNAENT